MRGNTNKRAAISKLVDPYVEHLSYRYHFQDGQNNLVFRYDNTPHFQEIETFLHHKHIQNKVIAADKPSTLHIIEEASLIAQ